MITFSRASLAVAVLPALLLAAGCRAGGGADGDTTSAGDPLPGSAGDTLPPAAERPPAPDGRECAMAPVTGRGIGDVSIGMSIDELRSRCTVTGDTTVQGAEGQPSRILRVAMGGETVDVEVKDERVWRIPVTDRELRTADSLGVGTPLAKLLELPDVTPAMGEGTYVLSPAHCGLSFQLRGAGVARTAEELRKLPRSLEVERMLVTGCESR